MDSYPVLFVLIAYFGLAASMAWLVFFSVARGRVRGWAVFIHQQLRVSVGAAKSASLRVSRRSLQAMTNFYRDGRTTIVHRRYLLLAAAVIASAPLLAALALRNFYVLEGFRDSTLEPSRVVTWLLRGEQLAPPPPLPPEVFVTREVEMVRPALAFGSRDWNLLDTEFRQRLLRVLKDMGEHHGYRMVLIEGYRSPERQTTLANQVAHVTNARAFQSYHQYGLAADIAFFRDGKLVISEADPWAMRGYQLFGTVAEAQGLTWGGRWKLRDFGHVELGRRGILGTAG